MPNGGFVADAMNRHALGAALVAGLVLLAGCSSGLTGAPDGTATSDSALDGETTATDIEGEPGTLNMYISDERNDIDDFEHLNVTITRVGVKPAGDDGDGEGSDDAEATADDNETADGANATESPETETETPDADDEAERTEEVDEADDGDESEWIEYEVDNRTVDLTKLKGANATKLSSLDVPNGSYDKVFVYVSDIDGTLQDGSDQRVKLPSGKLQLNSGFTVGNGEEVDFVFDITAIKAGNSGKYVLKPVVSESGTDVEIDDVDERDEDDNADDEGEADDEREEERSTELNASFDGDVAAGENVTLRVTNAGEPVDGATVLVGGDRVGATDADGTYVIRVPDDAEELDVTVVSEGAEADLDVELQGDGEESDGTTAADGSQRLTVG